MTRLLSALRLELTLQVRQKFVYAAIFSGLMWLAVLLPMPHSLRQVAEPYVLIGDVAIIGFFFIGGIVFFEKQERTLGAVISTPLRFWEYLTAKLSVLLAISLFVAVVVVTLAHGFDYHLLPLVVGVVLGTLLMLLVGFITSLPFASVTDWFLAAIFPLAIMLVPPIVFYSGLWPNPVLYIIPTQGPLLLLGVAFGQVVLAPWQVVFAVTYPIICVAGLSWAAKTLFGHYVIERSGVVMATSVGAITAFGRNDVRGTYRDPLLWMVVVAPVIWTTLVALLTPLVTEMLAERYGFDLVPYYPLVLTGFLLLTSIIIIGAIAAFLILDEVDAGTLTALRVTPVPLSTLFAYRAGTVMVLTTVYVVATLSFSGILEPGLVPALIPIGLLAGLSAIVTLLLIVAVASNKIQGIAMVRALGMLIAGLPCLPWFIDSAWNLAFGVLPPYWAAKAFWVASDHGTWWPYLLVGVVYNPAVAWPLFRRFVAKNT
jgi:fluoroquinolone transport system permease protein